MDELYLSGGTHGANAGGGTRGANAGGGTGEGHVVDPTF